MEFNVERMVDLRGCAVRTKGLAVTWVGALCSNLSLVLSTGLASDADCITPQGSQCTRSI